MHPRTLGFHAARLTIQGHDINYEKVKNHQACFDSCEGHAGEARIPYNRRYDFRKSIFWGIVRAALGSIISTARKCQIIKFNFINTLSVDFIFDLSFFFGGGAAAIRFSPRCRILPLPMTLQVKTILTIVCLAEIGAIAQIDAA
ncbi:hypothetical protein B1L08_20450 [Aeromonas veronii]|nr:hypothetical protein [Aeromonas veronii]